MSAAPGGIDELRDQLSPPVVRDIDAWRDHPELGKLHVSLHAHTDRRTFLNAYAEACVARHLLHHGCDLRFEVPTPTGRRADFEVIRDNLRFFLHVKRLSTDRPMHARLTVSSRLRILERINRPYIVSIRWREGLSDRQMQHLVTQAGRFIENPDVRVGDELRVRDDEPGGTREEIGGVRIMAPSDAPHVTLVIGLPFTSEGRASGFVEDAPRMRKLLRKAFLQFMPKATNVILMGTSHESDAAEFENALLGSHIERWDAIPPRGRRIAHGRAEDGFWSGQRYAESRAAAWFRFSLGESAFRSRLWLRDGEGMPEGPLLRELFGG